MDRNFSSRYSLPPSRKSSIDFDKEGLLITWSRDMLFTFYPQSLIIKSWKG
jgi:hypothetical protein